MREQSDYIIYVDESGDANLDNPNPSYPMFVLAFCIFKKTDYVEYVSPSIQQIKFKYFGHDAVVLHERDIRKQTQPFIFLKSQEKRSEFMSDLGKLMSDAPMTIIAASINKQKLKDKYIHPEDPYFLALRFCMERINLYLARQDQVGKSTHLIFEKRGKDEDSKLELEFLRIKNGRNYKSEHFDDLEIVFADKKANSGGLQIADLIARPIGLKKLRPDQANRAFEIITNKFDTGPKGDSALYGLKSFP